MRKRGREKLLKFGLKVHAQINVSCRQHDAGKALEE